MGDRLDSVQHIWQGAAEDFRTLRQQDNGALKSLGLVTIGASMAAYQAGGLETSVGIVTANVYDETHNPILAGLAGGGTSAVIELGVTLAVVAGLRRFPRMTEAYRDVKYKGKEPVVEEQGKFDKIADGVRNVSVAAVFGSPGITIGSYALSPEADLSVHRRRGLNTVPVLGVANTALLTAATGVIWANERFGAAGVSEAVVDLFESPVTYAGLAGLALILGGMKHAFRRRKS